MKSAYYQSIHGGRTGSRSRNAQLAELSGRMPATRAAVAWGFKSARHLKSFVTTREWHHVGKYANAVDYYDVESWLADLSDFSQLAGLRACLTKRGVELVLAQAVRQIVAENLAGDSLPLQNFKSNCNRKSRHQRLSELGLPWDFKGHLYGAEVEAYQLKRRLEAIEAKRKAFKARIKSNLAYTPGFEAKKSTREARFDFLRAKFGHHRASFIRREMRKMELTEANFLAVQKRVGA